MKLTSVELHPAKSNEFALLSFRDPTRENPFNVKEIVGLDADEIIPRYYGTSGANKFYSLSLLKRDIVLKINLSPRFGQSETYSDLRDYLYKMIASSRTGKIQLQFKNDTEIVAAINGFVSKFETAHFDQDQEVQLTVNCDEPMLKALTPTVMSLVGLNPAATTIQDTKSNAPHGFQFDIKITANMASIKITDPRDPTAWSFELRPVGGFLTNDVLHFSSEYNNKYLYYTRGATTVYLADVIQLGSIWPYLFPGNNTFAFTTPASLTWQKISYYPTYWGV
jgi:hypothetical protein